MQKHKCNLMLLHFVLQKINTILHIGGTTATTIGWKENFNMSFNDWVPAHYFARSYYRKIKNLFSGKFYLGGHSKGGNLAFAVALNLKESDLSHIARIDCFDGPGFS